MRNNFSMCFTNCCRRDTAESICAGNHLFPSSRALAFKPIRKPTSTANALLENHLEGPASQLGRHCFSRVSKPNNHTEKGTNSSPLCYQSDCGDHVVSLDILKLKFGNGNSTKISHNF